MPEGKDRGEITLFYKPIEKGRRTIDRFHKAQKIIIHDFLAVGAQQQPTFVHWAASYADAFAPQVLDGFDLGIGVDHEPASNGGIGRKTIIPAFCPLPGDPKPVGDDHIGSPTLKGDGGGVLAG